MTRCPLLGLSTHTKPTIKPIMIDFNPSPNTLKDIHTEQKYTSELS